MNLRLVAVGVCTFSLFNGAVFSQDAKTALPPDFSERKTTFALTRAETLAAAGDLDGAAAALTEAIGGQLSPEAEKRALALAQDLAEKKLRKSVVAMRRAEALYAEDDLDGANAALSEVFAANAGNDAKAVALARDIATKKNRQELSDEMKDLFEARLKRGQFDLADKAAAESESLSSHPGRRASEIQKYRVTKEAERLAIQETLNSAEDLLGARDFSGAQKRLEDLVKAELTDPQREKLAELSRRTIPSGILGWLGFVFDHEFLKSVVRAGGVVGGLFGLWLVARAIRKVWTLIWWRARNRKILGPIEDKSERGISDLLLSTLSHQKPAAAHLSASYFSAHIAVIPRARIKAPENPPTPPEIPLDALDSVTGNLASSLSKLFLALPRWWRAEAPTWSARAFKAEAELVVILTYRKSPNNIVSLECGGPADVSFTQLYSFIEDVVFTMYYLLENPDTDRDVARIAPNLRFAVDELELYAQAKGKAHLEKALEILRETQKSAPRSFDAKLFEAITLDILNRHDEAISRFEELRRDGKSYESVFFEDNRDAILSYNGAVAQLRRYATESLPIAEALINECVTATKPANVAEHAPLLYHLARATKANIIAHKILIWRGLLGDDKSKATSAVEHWKTEVFDIINLLRGIDLGPYTDQGRRQLQWAIANAEGNVHLNYATSFLAYPALAPGDEKEHKHHLEAAKQAFHVAERTLTPLVETLTNLATVYLQLKDFRTCRTYCDAAIGISPDYEYAFYRKAQSYLAENDEANVRKVLAVAPKITIPKFKELAARYP